VDTTAPDTTITAAPPATSTSSSASFSFTATEAGSSFACRLDASAFVACTSPQSYSGLANGSHSFQVRATDAAGNTDPTPASYTWTVDTTPPDTTPPDTTITAAPLAVSISRSASFSFTATEAGSTFACQLDGSAFAPCTSPRSYSGLTLGTHTFQVRATDRAGNTDPTPASYTWVVVPILGF
jgi:3-deoxy-D-arabino-heptulosonate 7-phosphate (DAHP) synthase